MEKIYDFKNELKELFEKYNVSIETVNNYDGLDDYCGTDLYFCINGIVDYSKTVSEIVREL